MTDPASSAPARIVATPNSPQVEVVQTRPDASPEILDPHASAVEIAISNADEVEVLSGPTMVLGGLRYQCRAKAPGAATAKISRMSGMLAKANGGDETGGGIKKLVEDDPEFMLQVSIVPDELYSIARSLLVPHHREPFDQRWEGNCPDSELFDHTELMAEVMRVIPEFTGQSAGKA